MAAPESPQLPVEHRKPGTSGAEMAEKDWVPTQPCSSGLGGMGAQGRGPMDNQSALQRRRAMGLGEGKVHHEGQQY